MHPIYLSNLNIYLKCINKVTTLLNPIATSVISFSTSILTSLPTYIEAEWSGVKVLFKTDLIIRIIIYYKCQHTFRIIFELSRDKIYEILMRRDIRGRDNHSLGSHIFVLEFDKFTFCHLRVHTTHSNTLAIKCRLQKLFFEDHIIYFALEFTCLDKNILIFIWIRKIITSSIENRLVWREVLSRRSSIISVSSGMHETL